MSARKAEKQGVYSGAAEVERLLIAAELSTFGVWDWDLRNDELYWSPAQMALLGVESDAFVPHVSSFFDRLHPDDVDHVRAALQRHLEMREPYDVLMRLRHEDGHYLTHNVRARALFDEQGDPYRITGVVFDVTREEEARVLLEDSERRFRDMVANVPGAVFRYVLRSDGTDEITYMSDGCDELWEIGADEIRGDPSRLWSSVLTEDLPAMQESVMASARTLAPWAHQWRIRTPSGKLKWVQGRGLPRLSPDGSVTWNSVILDITEQVEVERALYENREMLHHAQKMEALGQLTGGLAHDFNNLLAVVTSGLEYLREVGQLTEDARQAVEESIGAAQRGAELTRTLLSFARRAELAPETLALNSVAEAVAHLLRRILPANVSLTLELPENGPQIHADRPMLENALVNLVLNARDALPYGGRVTIRVGQRDEHLHPELGPGDYAWIQVVDDGIGMSEETRSRVFEPFFTTKAAGGTGLGLSMAHGFVNQSGGSIALESCEGEGTEVSLWFPRVEPGEQRGADAPGDAADAREGRILFVEDNPAVRRALARVLRRRGFEVVELETADEAIHRLEHERFDLVMTDVQMPGTLQGPDLARVAEARFQTPALLLSGNPPEDRDESYLTKPVRSGEMFEAIARRLRPKG